MRGSRLISLVPQLQWVPEGLKPVPQCPVRTFLHSPACGLRPHGTHSLMGSLLGLGVFF